MTTNVATPAMRVLALHDRASNAHGLHAALSSLDDRLYRRHGIELTYVNSPLALDIAEEEAAEKERRRVGDKLLLEDVDVDDAGEQIAQLELRDVAASEALVPSGGTDLVERDLDGQRVVLPPSEGDGAGRQQPSRKRRKWFDDPAPSAAAMNGVAVGTNGASTRPEEEDGQGAEAGQKFVGLDASILHLHQIWSRSNSSSPFSGVLAVGQGAAVAALLPLLGGREGDDASPMFDGLDFVVLIDGYDLLEEQRFSDEEDQCYVEEGRVESLHVYVSNNNAESGYAEGCSRRLARRYGRSSQCHEYVPGSSSPPPHLPNSALNAVGRFLVARKNDLLARPNGLALLNTQRRLAEAEHEAANAVARAIALDPPKKLLAVIAPNAVGGWTGPKARDPTDGGGAPCPAEFVLRREERQRSGELTEEGEDGTGGEFGAAEETDENEEIQRYRDAGREHPDSSVGRSNTGVPAAMRDD